MSLKNSFFIGLSLATLALPGVATAELLDVTTDRCDIDTFHIASGTTVLEAQWSPVQAQCAAGTYLRKNTVVCSKCLENHYCIGDTYSFNTDTDSGITECIASTFSPAGSKTANDCGHILHVGNRYLYLHANKTTSPALTVTVNGVNYYANLSTTEKQMNENVEDKLLVTYGGERYYAYDNTID